MLQYLSCLVLVASLQYTLSSPTNQFVTGDGRVKIHQTPETCYIRVKIDSCLEAEEIQVRVEGGTQTDLTIPVRGEDQDICVSVPCKDGQLVESVKLTATSTASSGLSIVVTPQTLDSTLVSVLLQDSSKCFDPTTEVGSRITCGEQSPAADSQNFVTNDGFNNKLDQVLNFICGGYNALNSIRSRPDVHGTQDRQYALTCRQVTNYNYPFENCYWAGPVNLYQQPFDFSCARDYVMSGMYSVHNNDFEDRVWNYQCCYAKDHFTKSCEDTSYLNDLDLEFTFDGGDRVFIGVHSYYDGLAKDRRWSVTHCDFVQA